MSYSVWFKFSQSFYYGERRQGISNTPLDPSCNWIQRLVLNENVAVNLNFWSVAYRNHCGSYDDFIWCVKSFPSREQAAWLWMRQSCPCSCDEGMWGSEGIAPLIPNLVTYGFQMNNWLTQKNSEFLFSFVFVFLSNSTRFLFKNQNMRIHTGLQIIHKCPFVHP
jgi:hypothetical protein